MLDLSRTLRFCLNGPPPPPEVSAAVDPIVTPARHNTFSAWPAMRGLGRFYQLHVVCRGEADPVTGYFMNIRRIDEAVRDHVLPYLDKRIASRQPTAAIAMGELMRDILALLQPALDESVRHVRLELTPYNDIAIGSDDMNSVVIRQQYEFSAAHRLHVDALGDAENRRIFGKCNNPSGHGHNYRLQVAVQAPIDPAGRVLQTDDLDRVVDEAVVQKLDHKHLNIDVPQFAKLNPSVENIARVVYEMLEGPIAALGVALDEVSVWETGKTVCTYRGRETAGV